MAPKSQLGAVEESSVEYEPAVAAGGESVYDAPSGTHQVMVAQGDTHYTNPQDCGFGYVSSIIWNLYRENGEIPDADGLLKHVYDMDVTYKDETTDGWTLMCKLSDDFAHRLINQAGFVLRAFFNAVDVDVDDARGVCHEDMADVCLTFMESQMFLKTLKAMHYEISAVELYSEENDASEVLATDEELTDAGLGGESAGVDAAAKVDGEWVTLQVKPDGMGDKGNADVLLTYGDAKVAGKAHIYEVDRRED